MKIFKPVAYYVVRSFTGHSEFKYKYFETVKPKPVALVFLPKDPFLFLQEKFPVNDWHFQLLLRQATA